MILAIVYFATGLAQPPPLTARMAAASVVTRHVGPNACVAPAASSIPINFWLLVEGDGPPPPDDVSLCAQCCENHRASDAAAVERDLEALSARAAAVELCGDARTFLLPGARLARVGEVSFGEGGLGHSVWDAGIALSIWLARNPEVVAGERVLELGSGVGLGGVSAGLAGAASVTLSDVAEESSGLRRGASTRLLENLESNAHLNGLDATTSAVALDWEVCVPAEFEPTDLALEPFPVIVGSDLVYYEHTAPALAAAVVKLLAPGGAAYMVNVQGRRGGDSLLDLLADSREGQLEIEELGLVNNYGRSELVLTTFRKNAHSIMKPARVSHDNSI